MSRLIEGVVKTARRRRSRAVVVAAIGLTAVACADRIDRPRLPALSTDVTGAAAAALRANGQFALARAPSGVVTDSQARALSTAFVREFGYFFVVGWEADHGGVIDYTRIHACGRSFYAHNPYAPLPSTASFYLREKFGDYWLTTLCGEAGDPEVSVAVAAVDTQYHVDSGGFITGIAGNDSSRILAVGIAPGLTFPPSPESAVRQAADWTQRRVAEVPALILPPPPYMPQLARWRLALEAPARFTELVDGTEHDLSDVYFGYGDAVARKGLWLGRLCGPAQFPAATPPSFSDTTIVSVLPGYSTCYWQIDTTGQRHVVHR